MRSVFPIIGALATILLMASPSLAQSASPIAVPQPDAPLEANPFSTRGGALPSVMRWLQGEAIPLTYLGDDGGLKGYLGESASGRYQTFYPTPDGDYVLVGILFRTGGDNITHRQIAEMRRRFNEAATKSPGVDVSSLQDPPSPPALEDTDISMLQWFREGGFKVSEIDSSEGGVKAFLVETVAATDGDTGRMQMFYQLPDPRYAVAGILMQRGGVNVTGLQIGYLQERFVTQQKTQDMTGSPVSTGPKAPAAPEVDLSSDASSATTPKTDVTAQTEAALEAAARQLQMEIAPAAPAVEPQPAEAIEPAPTVATAAPAPVFSSAPISTQAPEAAVAFQAADIGGSEFLDAAAKTVFFTVGLPDRPALYMVADPQCPFCHEAWRTLKNLVFDGKIQVRVIMIAGLRGSDPIARAILSQPDPSAAWLSGQGSIPNTRIPAGPDVGSKEWNAAGNFLQINAGFIHKFNITQTPFLGYVTPEGAMIASRGVPKDFDSFLAALK